MLGNKILDSKYKTKTSKKLSGLTYQSRRPVLTSFLIALLTAVLLFVPFIIYNGGIFYYYGDFNVQEIPFYQICHDAVRSGQMGWNHTTDLGSDLISSYSFYILGSPFFWLTIPFPNWFVPYLIGPLLILKFKTLCAQPTVCRARRTFVRIFGIFGIQYVLFSLSRADNNVSAAACGA